jgi:phage terminase large subunit GpA-like protein
VSAWAAIGEIASAWLGVCEPPPRLTVTQWADAERYLSPEGSALPGKYASGYAPYQREMMDSTCDPEVSSTCLMLASQLGKTETVNNIVGFFIAADPSPILVVQPTIDLGESWSKERLVPMIRDTPCLRGLVTDPRSRDSGNTILHKSFPGGNIAIAGANAPAGLAGRPRRVVLLDEVDRFPPSAGTEGDPCLLAIRRAESFWNAVVVMTSTPTTRGFSRIESEFLQTDQRRWFCPCQKCGEMQVLEWGQVRWPEGEPEAARYVCRACGHGHDDPERVAMVRAGEWRATAPFTGKRGYHLNGIASPFPARKGYRSRLHQMAAGFIEAKRGGREMLKTWTNTFLAETWEEEGATVDAGPLYRRREAYPLDPAPAGVLCVTAGADVQADRVEVELVGWGDGEESWGLGYHVFVGNPAQPVVWEQVDALLSARVTRHDGAQMPVAATCIDSAGGATQQVYAFCSRRLARRVFAVKGLGGPGHPLVGRPKKSGVRSTPLLMIGTDTAKEIIYSRLAAGAGDPGYCHFPMEYDAEWFGQLTAEKIVTRYTKGVPYRAFENPGRARNEALDCRVYALAALAVLNPNWASLKKSLGGPSGAPSAPRRRRVWAVAGLPSSPV